ncbi:MAG: NAD(P)-dependent alcohol dehydrogenase [Bacteroidota bacterium]
MNAYVATGYGPPEVVELQEVDTPRAGPNEVLIRIQATTVSAGDWRLRSLDMPAAFRLFARLAFGWKKLRQPILGTEFVGEIAEVGAEVERFAVGDVVCGFADPQRGAHAEYIAILEDAPLTLKPASLSTEEAAALGFGGLTASAFFRRGRLVPGDRILINGASGAVGTAAIQLAKYHGAHVTAVCSGRNAELVRSLGADEVVDYTQTSIADLAPAFDIVMENAASLQLSDALHLLRPGGRLLMVNGSPGDLLRSPWVAWRTGKDIVAGPSTSSATDLNTLASLAEAGQYRPVVDRVYPFESMIEAHRYVDTGRKRGNVVVRVQA